MITACDAACDSDGTPMRRRTSPRLDAARRRPAARVGGAARGAHARRVRFALVIGLVTGLAAGLAAACGAAAPVRPTPTTGAIAGLARDLDSGDPIAKAEIRVRGADAIAHVTSSSERGQFDVAPLRPGVYQLTATFAGQPVEVSNIDVRAGETTVVDLTFTLGRPEPRARDFSDPAAAIHHYRPRALPPSQAVIEGTVNDSTTRRRVVGAVVTAAPERDPMAAHQTVSDERGRYRFDAVTPGTYDVSAYYSVGGRGQIEVRRSGITVAGAEAVMVPLWIELDR